MSKSQPEIEISEVRLITKEFDTNIAFSIFIEAAAYTKNITIFEMLMEYCTDNDIDPVAISAIITRSLKEKIEDEMQKLNLLKPKKAK